MDTSEGVGGVGELENTRRGETGGILSTLALSLFQGLLLLALLPPRATTMTQDEQGTTDPPKQPFQIFRLGHANGVI